MPFPGMTPYLDDDSPEGTLRRMIAGFSQPAPPGAAPAPTPAPAAPDTTGAAPMGAPAVITNPNSPPPITAPVAPSAAATRQAGDESYLAKLQREGSGVEQYRTGKDAQGNPIPGKHPHPILGTIARIGDVALSSLFPTVAMATPGTTFHHGALENRQAGRVSDDVKQRQDEAQTADLTAQAEQRQHPLIGKTPEEQTFAQLLQTINPKTNKPYTPEESFAHVKQLAQDTKPEVAGRTITTDKGIFQWNPETNKYDIPAGNAPDKKPDSLDQQYQDAIERGDTAAATRILKVKHDLAAAGQAPERPQKPQQVLMTIPQPDGLQKVIEVTPGMTIPGAASKPGEAAAASRKDITAHDRDYIKPAEATEKSYQMMQHAYQEYEAARAAGKTLPTGAQSMLALSQHMATTFGGVKGNRVTKEMIQEHLGARSISDSALVAIQRLTNGDALAPDQWEAFYQLIGESRKISWQQAAKAADRKHIPVDFLPEDLKDVSHEPGGDTSGEQAQAPAVGAVVDGYRFKGGKPGDQNNWEKVQAK